MRIPPHWKKESYTGADENGADQTYWAWGWSFDSLAAAKQDAQKRARRIFDLFASGRQPDFYDYSEHPLREEIVETIGSDDDQPAVITRNRYGALVLNCPSVCFVDVDFPQAESKGVIDSLRMLFSAKKRQEKAEAGQQVAIQSVLDWSERNPRRSFRLYRTAAGLRLLFTDRLYDPKSNEVRSLLEELGSDALYQKLTLKQECFRARLTPKPWRCGSRRPPNRYPWESARDEQAYRNWQRAYEKMAKSYAICRLLDKRGSGPSNETIARVVDVHDHYACRSADAPLA